MVKYYKRKDKKDKIEVDVTIEDLSLMIQKICLHKEGRNIKIETITDGLMECLRYAMKQPDRFREYRHELLSNRKPEMVPDEFPLKYLYNIYGPRSWYTNTAAKVVSLVRLSDLEVKRRTKNFTPPAFDMSLPYKDPVEWELNAYYWLDKWEEVEGLRNIIHILSDTIKEYRNKYNDPDKRRIVLLDNNSSQSYCSGTVNITDLMSNIYVYPYLKDPVTEDDLTFSHLSKLTGVLNSRDESDPFCYLLKEDIFTDHKFKVIAIPDKDGKIRIIFLGAADIQTVSKGLHEMFDSAARKMDGNYTYNQRDWIEKIISNQWHKFFYIVGTDMSKYSDTLHRKFIIKILEKAGMTPDELREIDMLYSLPVENLDGTILGDVIRTMASYQGQYGDFPLITIANLALQSIVKHCLHEPMIKDGNAAVGDDTGFVFLNYHPNAMEVIKKVYGSVGVRINESKTGQLHHKYVPDGVVDFVKLRFDKDGLIPFFEPKPYFNKDFDQAIRDIYDSIFLTKEEKSEVFTWIFDDQVRNLLMDKSVINGGINFRLITPEDVNELISNKIMLTDLNKIRFGSFYTWMNQVYKEMLECGFSWRDTVFSETKGVKDKLNELKELLSNNDILLDEYEARADGLIMLEVAKVAEIGLKHDPADFHELVGQNPVDIWNNHKLKKNKQLYNKELERFYEMIKDSESVMGRLKKKNVKGSHTVYKSKIEFELGDGELEDWLNISKSIKPKLIEFDDIKDYQENIVDVVKYSNAYKTYTYLRSTGLLIERTNAYGTHWYVKWNRVQYRLFNNHPTSKYPPLTEQIRAQIPVLCDWNIEELFEYYNKF